MCFRILYTEKNLLNFNKFIWLITFTYNKYLLNKKNDT